MSYTPNGQVPGTNTNDNAVPGDVGEEVISRINDASATNVPTSNVPVNVTSILLTPGDWDISGSVKFLPAGTTSGSGPFISVSQNSAATPNTDTFAPVYLGNYAFAAGVPIVLPITATRISIAVSTTYYLIAQIGFLSSTMAASGFIRARRMR